MPGPSGLVLSCLLARFRTSISLTSDSHEAYSKAVADDAGISERISLGIQTIANKISRLVLPLTLVVNILKACYDYLQNNAFKTEGI